MKIRHSAGIHPFEIREEDIQKCAYFLWQEEGCPSGRDLDLWLAAKELLRHRTAARSRAARKKCASKAKMRAAAGSPFG
jgi:hypothetical protein